MKFLRGSLGYWTDGQVCTVGARVGHCQGTRSLVSAT